MATDELPSIVIPLTYEGQMYLVNGSKHKVLALSAEAFTCGFCKQFFDEGQSRYSKLRAETADGRTIGFTFCGECVSEAMTAFPDLPNIAVVRAIVARIERDGALSDDG